MHLVAHVENVELPMGHALARREAFERSGRRPQTRPVEKVTPGRVRDEDKLKLVFCETKTNFTTGEQ